MNLPTMSTNLKSGSLVCEGLSKSYDGVQVLKSVNLEVKRGSVVGLIGENGAGKSTLSSIIAGVTQADGGSMRIGNDPYGPSSPAHALHLGVALIHQEIRMVPELSVAENIFLGRPAKRAGLVRQQVMVERAAEALELIGASHIDPRRRIGDLSIANQQEIEIARAISRRPRFIIFDEPSASLGETEVERILHRIAAMRDSGAGVIYVSHKLDEVRQIADTVVTLRDGARVAEFGRDVDTRDMVSAMVGRDLKFQHERPAPPRENAVLSVSNLSRPGVFHDIEFDVRAGEILGFAGLVGAGRTEVVRALAGADKFSGKVSVDGREVRINSTGDAIKHGIVMVPEDRKVLGLLLEQTAEQNLTTPWERRIARFGLVLKRDIRAVRDRMRGEYEIRGRTDIPVKRLSGGNQQKVLLAKWLLEMPRVLILDEPTKGVDIGAKSSIYALVRRLATQGVAVIVVSSEMEEVLGLSHRVAVMSGGRIRGILDRDDATGESVMQLALPTPVADNAAVVAHNRTSSIDAIETHGSESYK